MIKKIDITGCSRCGKDHKEITIKEFAQPIKIDGVGYTHYTRCPTNDLAIFICTDRSGSGLS